MAWKNLSWCEGVWLCGFDGRALLGLDARYDTLIAASNTIAFCSFFRRALISNESFIESYFMRAGSIGTIRFEFSLSISCHGARWITQPAEVVPSLTYSCI